jgi:hypothetical protein
MGTDLERYVPDKDLINFIVFNKGVSLTVHLRITDAFNIFLKFVDDYLTKYIDNQTSTLLDSLYFIQANGLPKLYVL